MSGMIKFLKSLVSSEPAASRVVAKATELTPSSSSTASPSASPSHSTSSTPSTPSIPSRPEHVQAIKPHVPLIKFRKGGPTPGHAAVGGAASPGGVAAGRAAVSRGIIEDYQLPSRYHRTPLDAKEIDYINRGGPE